MLSATEELSHRPYGGNGAVQEGYCVTHVGWMHAAWMHAALAGDQQIVIAGGPAAAAFNGKSQPCASRLSGKQCINILFLI